MKIFSKIIILFSINVVLPIMFYFLFNVYLIRNSILFFLINIVITSLLILIYILFSTINEKKVNFDLSIIKIYFKDKIDEKRIRVMQLNIDTFIVTSSLIIPNLVFSIFVLNNGNIFFLMSLIPFLGILIIALIQLSKKGKTALNMKKYLLKQIIEEFQNTENKLESLGFYNLIKAMKVISYPKISILFLITGVISQIFTFSLF